jgi:hypothetical protein
LTIENGLFKNQKLHFSILDRESQSEVGGKNHQPKLGIHGHSNMDLSIKKHGDSIHR